MTIRIDPSWQSVLQEEFTKSYWESLTTFVKTQYAEKKCFPEGKNIFRAFDMTPFENVKVVILGQDPYHTP
jgi:uracil-DNA glycosylase